MPAAALHCAILARLTPRGIDYLSDAFCRFSASPGGCEARQEGAGGCWQVTSKLCLGI
jgi:hypothetical protein